MTNLEVSNKITKLEQAMIALNDKIITLENKLVRYATQGQLKQSESNTKNIINQNSILINDLQIKLETVSIPTDTKYYLSTTEIEEFRNNYQTLIAMMTDADKLYQSIISYVSQFKLR